MSEQQANLNRILPAVVSVFVIAADRASKVLIRHSMGGFDTISIVPGWIRIIHTENPGAAFGVLSTGNPVVRSCILIGVSSLVLIFVASALWSRRTSFEALATRIGLSLILGGAVGNLYDRIVHGMVTDFLEVYHGLWSFPAFNVADSAITVGAIALLIDLVRPRRKPISDRSELARK